GVFMTPYFALGRALVAAIALSLTLAACGGDDDSDDGATAPPETGQPETPPPAPQLRCAP
ncbi:hypothetical protein, partial [Achromobacter sp. GD03932]|uniref:hypothetical protein n=2 Tax=Alcaligenaceae TaxID=506 RepID=UPI00244B6D4A